MSSWKLLKISKKNLKNLDTSQFLTTLGTCNYCALCWCIKIMVMVMVKIIIIYFNYVLLKFTMTFYHFKVVQHRTISHLCQIVSHYIIVYPEERQQSSLFLKGFMFTCMFTWKRSHRMAGANNSFIVNLSKATFLLVVSTIFFFKSSSSFFLHVRSLKHRSHHTRILFVHSTVA